MNDFDWLSIALFLQKTYYFILLFVKTLNYLPNNSYNSGRKVISLKIMGKHYNYKK